MIILAVCDFNRPQHCSSTTFIYFCGHLYQSFVKLIIIFFNSCIFRKLFLSIYLQRTKLLLSNFPKIYIILIIYTVQLICYAVMFTGSNRIHFFKQNFKILDNSNLMRIYFLVLSTKPQLIAGNRLLHYSLILACSALKSTLNQ